MRGTIAIIGVAFAAVGGAYAGTVLPVDLSQQQVGVCTGASCSVSSTSAGTFENTTFATLYPTNPTSPTTVPNVNAVSTSFGPSGFIIDSASNYGSGANTNSAYNSPTTSGNHTATLLIDLGSCTGIGAVTANNGPGAECGIPDVDDVYTMLNGGGSLGVSGQNIIVTVEGVNAAEQYTTDVFTLLPGVDYRVYTTAVSGADCTVADSPNNSSNTSCVGAGSGPTNTSSVSGTDPNNSNITVYNNVFGSQTSGTTAYDIDTQALSLGTTFQGGYVDSVLIQYTGPTGSVNRTMQLSALSVDTTAPEPGTLAMLGIGFGLIGFRTIRSRRANKAAVSE